MHARSLQPESVQLHAHEYIRIFTTAVISTIAGTVATPTTSFKRLQGQILNGRLLSLSKSAMVVFLNDSLITLRTLIDEKQAECLLDSGASHNFLALGWCSERGLKIEDNNQFGVKLADGQEVPAVGKARCLIDLGPMNTALTFYGLDCNVPCVLGVPFLQTVNPIINWATRSVQVCTVLGLSLLEMVSSELKPQCEIVSAK